MQPERSRPRSVTLATIAEAVGVSRMTVSNAYNRPDQLSPELRERILSTARELGYSGPHAAARTLRRGRAGTIGVLFTDALSYAFADPAAVLFLQGLATVGEEAGIGLQLLPVTPGGGDPGLVIDAVVDGFVLFALPDDHPLLDVVLARRLPCVTVSGPERPDMPYVGIDERAAARTAAEHLIGLGHRRIGIITFRLAPDFREGPVTRERLASAPDRVSRERLLGFTAAQEEAGMAWDAVPIEERHGNGRPSGHDAARALLHAHPDITALLTTSDELAVGALAAARQSGLDVPRDLSVVGFDDTPVAAAADLTTIAQPLVEQGAAAGRLVLSGGGRPPPLFPTSLVVRGSTAPPAE